MGAVVTIPLAAALTIIITNFFDVKYWYKWIVSVVYIEFSRCRSKRRFDLYDMDVEHDPHKNGFLPPPEETALESPLPESQLHSSSDEVFFYGMNSKSDFLTVRLSRKPDDWCEAHVRLTLSDGRTYELKETDGRQQSCCDAKVFSCGDLQVHYLSPMRRWRIFFNGLMSEQRDDFQASEKFVHVKFALLWRASSDAFDFTTDINTTSLAAAFANTKWNHPLPPLEKLNSALDMYAQSGVILGVVTIDGDEHNLYLFGGKVRSLGNLSVASDVDSHHIFGWCSKDGRIIHIVEVSIADVVDKLRFGYMVQPTGGIYAFSDATIPLEKPDKGQLKHLKTQFQAHGDVYEFHGKHFKEQSHFQSDSTLSKIHLLITELNTLKGQGIIFTNKTTGCLKPALLKKTAVSVQPSEAPYAVHFSDPLCQNSEITGGKGSSLGKLTELSKELKDFTVSEGIVVTTSAYAKFLSNDVIQEIKNLEACLYSENIPGEDIKKATQKVVDKVVESTVPQQVRLKIVSQLEKTFPGMINSRKFAVRSSATGEDTEQLSAAGQMETYLGITGIDEIILAVKKCWASQFGFCAVQYKKQNGQVLNCPMAVAVQEMVPCDVAGVLFTCDPLTGNPTTLSITANYGLGESVVSGSEEPDTIELARSKDDQLVIRNKIIGSKKNRIVIDEHNEGTRVEEVPESEQSTCCMSEENIIRLGDLAIKLRKSYRSHRDLEWGYWKNNLYIFQSRPVTSGKGETDFEIDHEMDAPLRVEDDYFTVSNIGEVMPGAMSPLGSEVLLKYFYIVFQKPNCLEFLHEKRSKYFSNTIVSMYSHTMVSCLHLFRKTDTKTFRNRNCIALFGRLIDDEEMFEMAKSRFSCIKLSKITKIRESLFKIANMLFNVKRRLGKCQKKYENFRISVEKYKTSREMFDAMMHSSSDLVESFATHMLSTETSAIWNIIIFSILQAANGEVNANVYADVAKLLTTCNEVESADVPSTIEEISECISKDIKPDEFKKMNTKEALNWLKSSTSEAGVKFREFLHKHGHRCLREFDIRSKTWLTDPSSLIQLLQSTVGKQKKAKIDIETEDYTTLISNLKSPLNSIMRLFMRFLVPMSRKSVMHRECSKSVTIRGLNEWRRGYSKLAQLMVGEGRIPDHDLLYFMTVEDIRELLDTRSPRIIAKANHRRRRYPILDKYIFPEISRGVPKPINMEDQPITLKGDTLSMKGIPVSQGVAKGFIRVAITLEEASLLQAGEILVTYSTDIGWSPYFPILSGVVTELGGLISHGAVVSREYGLPCISGLHGATRQFQTGDYALLNGNTGVLHKLSLPEIL